MEKKERSEWLSRQLTEYGMPAYGRASGIARDLGCSNAVAQGWLNGSLAKNMEQGLQFADRYGFTLREWVTGIRSDSDIGEKVLSAIRLTRGFESEFGALTTDQFIHVVTLISSDKSGGDFYANNLSNLAKILK